VVLRQALSRMHQKWPLLASERVPLVSKRTVRDSEQVLLVAELVLLVGKWSLMRSERLPLVPQRSLLLSKWPLLV
jgi:hypothetical protein